MHANTPAAFDIVLLPRTEAAPDARAILAAIEGSGRAFRLRADPGHYVYRNDDTGVYFHVTVSPEVLARRPRRETDGDGPGEEDEEYGPPLEEEEPARGEEDDGGEEEDEDEEPFEVVMAPVTLTLPLLVPDFFPAEAVELGLHIAESADLLLDSPALEVPAAGPPAGGRAAGEILAAWADSSRAAALAPDAGTEITTWAPKKAADWWDYGRRRALLEAELAREGISVPTLRAAVHEGEVKSLFIWETGKPSVLPRTDLVLVRRERGRMGLLRLRKTVEEGIVAGARVWDLLAPFSERRTEPVEILIFRNARTPPSPVAADLEVMRLEPLESVRRTELTGVVVAPTEARKEE